MLRLYKTPEVANGSNYLKRSEWVSVTEGLPYNSGTRRVMTDT